MSKLYYTENGHAIPSLGEEVTTFRRARKVLRLEPTSESATVYFVARPYPDSALPLRVSINGEEIEPIRRLPLDHYAWYQVAVGPALLKAGDNTFDFWCDSTAMNAWSLATEPGHEDPRSYISDDAGQTWRNHHMSYLNVVRGEYVVRVRLAEGEDPPPPPMVWEDPDNPKLESLRRIIPQRAREPGPLPERIRALTTWLSSSWEHTPYGPGLGSAYSPWDPETVLAWAPSQCGHNGQRPVANCIFYGVSFVASCQAVGIPARCAIFADRFAGQYGHFTAEYWSDEHQKWAMVDPNLDAIFIKDGAPLSVTEIQEASPHLAEVTDLGPGYEAQRRNPRMVRWFQDGYSAGRSFRHRSVWYRADQLTHPEFSPPSHGAGVAYSETGIVWERRDKDTWGMFPYFGSPEYFDAPPNRLAKDSRS